MRLSWCFSLAGCLVLVSRTGSSVGFWNKLPQVWRVALTKSSTARACRQQVRLPIPPRIDKSPPTPSPLWGWGWGVAKLSGVRRRPACPGGALVCRPAGTSAALPLLVCKRVLRPGKPGGGNPLPKHLPHPWGWGGGVVSQTAKQRTRDLPGFIFLSRTLLQKNRVVFFEGIDHIPFSDRPILTGEGKGFGLGKVTLANRVPFTRFPQRRTQPPFRVVFASR